MMDPVALRVALTYMQGTTRLTDVPGQWLVVGRAIGLVGVPGIPAAMTAVAVNRHQPGRRVWSVEGPRR